MTEPNTNNLESLDATSPARAPGPAPAHPRTTESTQVETLNSVNHTVNNLGGATEADISATEPAVDPASVLLSLSWLGELTLNHIRRLHFPERQEPTVRRLLTRLKQHDPPLIQLRRRAVRVSAEAENGRAAHIQEPVTRPLPGVWSLTPSGHELVRRHAQYPLKDAKAQYQARAVGQRRKQILEHDLLLVDLVVKMIEVTRQWLSGIYVGHDLRLDPESPRPVMDGLIVLHFEEGPLPPGSVPWTKDRATPHERQARCAVEIDRGTEPIATIAAKAQAYQSVFTNERWYAWWQARYAQRPVILWVVPDEARLEAVRQTWMQAWPDGRFMIATVQGVAEDRWLRYDQGRTSQRGLFANLARTQALPTAPAALVARFSTAATSGGLSAPPSPAAYPADAAPASVTPEVRPSMAAPAPLIVIPMAQPERIIEMPRPEEYQLLPMKRGQRAVPLRWLCATLQWTLALAGLASMAACRLVIRWPNVTVGLSIATLMLALGIQMYQTHTFEMISWPVWPSYPALADKPMVPLTSVVPILEATPGAVCTTARVRTNVTTRAGKPLDVQWLNVRSKPSLDAQIVTVVSAGSVLVRLENRQDQSGMAWTRVQTSEGRQGWASAAYLETICPA
jgi:Replication-relaxation/Bacterial SH3 domain